MSAARPEDPSPGTNPPWNCTLQEWMHCLGRLLEIVPTTADGPSAAEVGRQWFDQQYSDPQESAWRFERVMRARSYLELHHGEFAEFEAPGPQGRGHLISPRLMSALGRWFTGVPEDALNYDVPVERILRMARGEE